MKKYNQQLIELPKERTSEIDVQKIEKSSSRIFNSVNYQVIWSKDNLHCIHDRTQEFNPGGDTLILLQPGHQILLHLTDKYQECWKISLSPTVFMNLCMELFRAPCPDVFLHSNAIQYIKVDPAIGVKISSIFELTAEIIEAGIDDGDAAVYALIKTLFIYCKGSKTTGKTDTINSRYTEIVRLFRHHISMNFPEHHHVAYYASLLNVTPKYLYRIIKETTGMTAKSLILKQLLTQACHDLEHSNLSVKEIAIKLGFSEPEHFSNFFRKSAGCSPKTFRENLLKTHYEQQRSTSYSPHLSLTKTAS